MRNRFTKDKINHKQTLEEKTAMMKECFRIGHIVEDFLNANMEGYKLELEKIYLNLLLIKKKNYAAMKYEEYAPPPTKPTYSGMDTKRMDNCRLLVSIQSECMYHLFVTEDEKKAEQTIIDYIENIRKDKYDFHQYIITKKVGKSEKEYKTLLPQVKVALENRIETGDLEKTIAGKIVQYIIINNGKKLICEKAMNPLTCYKKDIYNIDRNYYINQLKKKLSIIYNHIDKKLITRIFSNLPRIKDNFNDITNRRKKNYTFKNFVNLNYCIECNSPISSKEENQLFCINCDQLSLLENFYHLIEKNGHQISMKDNNKIMNNNKAINNNAIKKDNILQNFNNIDINNNIDNKNKLYSNTNRSLQNKLNRIDSIKGKINETIRIKEKQHLKEIDEIEKKKIELFDFCSNCKNLPSIDNIHCDQVFCEKFWHWMKVKKDSKNIITKFSNFNTKKKKYIENYKKRTESLNNLYKKFGHLNISCMF